MSESTDITTQSSTHPVDRVMHSDCAVTSTHRVLQTARTAWAKCPWFTMSPKEMMSTPGSSSATRASAPSAPATSRQLSRRFSAFTAWTETKYVILSQEWTWFGSHPGLGGENPTSRTQIDPGLRNILTRKLALQLNGSIGRFLHMVENLSKLAAAQSKLRLSSERRPRRGS